MLPTLKLPSLSVILGVLGNYWVLFQAHVGVDLKTAAVAAGTFLIGWANHQEQATKRSETAAAASLGQAPVAMPSVAEIQRQVMATLGHQAHPAGAAGVPAGSSLVTPIPPGPHTL